MHRGPDAAGCWQEQGITLVHRRLAILDTSALGQQPMASACGRWRLVFNGEIYNYRELRRHLEALGHRFRSSGDTEVLLQLLIRYGTAALGRLRGMYAFCLWDAQERSALLARDPYGIKPLYLHHGPGGSVVFASELRAVLASGLVPRRLDPKGLAAFLQHGSLPADLTLVENVQALPPGWLATWRHGRLQLLPHWRPSFQTDVYRNAAQQIALTREALQDSITLHLRSDVPVGLFLSGGRDSASILALAAGGVHSLSIGFAETGYDESLEAAALARAFGSVHQRLLLGSSDAASLLPGFLSAVDQPSVDGFNTYCVSALAAAEGLKVVLSGLGGDELFGGYPSFQRVPRAVAIQRCLGPAAPWCGRRLQAWRLDAKVQRLAAGLQGPACVPGAHQVLRGLFAPVEIQRLMCAWGLPLSPPPPWPDPLPAASPLDQVAWLESSVYMGDQLLRDSDTFSMAHGLELRVPFVDSQLFRSLAPIPASCRLAPGKGLLRAAIPELEPYLARKPKQGFSLPFPQWFSSGPLADTLQQRLPPLPPGVDQRPWARRWGLMVLNHWLDRHLGLTLAP